MPNSGYGDRCTQCGGPIMKDETNVCFTCGRFYKNNGRPWVKESRRLEVLEATKEKRVRPKQKVWY